MTENTGKMKSLTIQEKLEIIEKIERGKSIKDVSEETGMNRNSLHYILKNRNKIREEVFKNPTLSKHKRIKQTKNPELETSILNFIYDSRDKGEKLTGSIIKAVALELSLKMNIKNFGASNGWLFSFFKRNGLSLSDFNNKIVTNIPDENITKEIEIESIECEQSEQEANQVVQYEVEYQENVNNTDQYTEIIENNDWKNWCKLCGSTDSTEELYADDYNAVDMFSTFFKFNSNNELKSCAKCKVSFEESYMFLYKAKISGEMFTELEDLERFNNLTDENMHNIRQKYLVEEQEQIIYDNQIDKPIENSENQEILYEEHYLEEEIPELNKIEDYVVIEESIEVQSKNTENLNISKVQSDEDYIYECHICGENFERMCFLTNHTRQMHSCLPQVACSCGKYLATWDSLMAHKRKHSLEPADWICDKCDSKFHTKIGLSIHIKFKHHKKSEKFVYSCEICNLEFSDASSLKSHTKLNHSSDNEKSLVECNFCNKKLSSKYSLKDHITTVHEKQKTILCHLCSKGFSNKSNLRSHLVSHTTEYVSCQICNQIFKNRVSLQSHKKIHKPHESLKFACSQCDKRFHNRNHLERHLISHSSEKKFKCAYDGCSAAYKWEKDLKNHESVHRGVKKHQCNFCERFFTDVANLRKHKLKHHQEELTDQEIKYGKRKSIAQNL